MIAEKSPIHVIESSGIEARIYQIQYGYRAEINGTETEFYWHPGIFQDFYQLKEWLKFELEKLEAGFFLRGDWLMLEGDFDGNSMYKNWFICHQQQNWQGFDPLTNRCYTASSWKALKEKIDQIELTHSRRESI